MKTKENSKIFYITALCVVVTLGLIISTLIRSHRPSRGRPYERLSVEDARMYMSYEPEYLILDVRDHSSYEEGHLDDAVNIEYDSLVEKADDVLKNRSVMVYVYGETSQQSCAAAQKLTDIGYNSVSEIGSYRDWTVVETETETEGILTNVLG